MKDSANSSEIFSSQMRSILSAMTLLYIKYFILYIHSIHKRVKSMVLGVYRGDVEIGERFDLNYLFSVSRLSYICRSDALDSLGHNKFKQVTQ